MNPILMFAELSKKENAEGFQKVLQGLALLPAIHEQQREILHRLSLIEAQVSRIAYETSPERQLL